jgi:Flp pilus assembly protein TadB
MFRMLAVGVLAIAAAAMVPQGATTAEAAQKKKGAQGGTSDQAATMTAIALAESGGNSRSKKTKSIKSKQKKSGTGTSGKYKLENAWPSK